MKKIIGVDARPLAYGFTGNSRYLWEALKEILRQTDTFEFILYTNKPLHPVFQEILNHKSIQLAPIYPVMGILWLNFILPFLLKRDKVHAFWGTLQLLPIFKLSIPTIVNYHDMNFLSAKQTMTLLNYWQHKLLSRFTLKNADKILCLSQNTQREIHAYRAFTKSKTSVIYPGANRNKIISKSLNYQNFILTVGTLEPRKNFSTLLKAYLKLKEEYPSYPYALILAGRMGWGDPNLALELKAGKYEDLGVKFIENPSETELAYLYHNCIFFVFPSLHEGFGLPLVEAMIENKCCIASDIPVFREILDSQNDLLVPSLEIDSWKKALLEMANRKTLIRNPLISEKDWSWENTAQKIIQELLEILYKD